MVHLDRSGKPAPAGLALALIEEQGACRDLVKTWQLLRDDQAHSQVRCHLALEVGKRHPVAALLTVSLSWAHAAGARHAVGVSEVP
eukprot:6550190-Alexandrium_andersonii.AAC.1